MKIVVLCGGTSTEREISIVSGSGVCRALRSKGHHAILLDVFFGDEYANLMDAFPEKYSVDDAVEYIHKCDSLIESAVANPSRSFFGANVTRLCKMADIVFLALHGENGENGKVQAALDLLRIRYTGTGHLGSAMAMDKGITKTMLASHGVPVPGGFSVKKADWEWERELRSEAAPSSPVQKDQDAQAAELFEAARGEEARVDREKKKRKDTGSYSDFLAHGMELPAVVKVCCGGSSVGVYIARTEAEYERSMEEAFAIEEEVLVEEYIEGREFSVGVIDGEALPVIEIAPLEGFYDYKNKYTAGATVETCPAELPGELSRRMREYAVKGCEALCLDAYARLDFMMRQNGEIFCLEANTLPGMTPTSLIPQEAAALGVDYPSLCERLIEASLKKYQ